MPMPRPRRTPLSLALLPTLAAFPAPARPQPETTPATDPYPEPGVLQLHAPALTIESHAFGVMHTQLRWAASPAGEQALPAFARATRDVEAAAGTPRIWLLLDPDIVAREEFSLPAWLDALPLDRTAEPDRTDQARRAIETYLDEWLIPHTLATADSWESTTLPSLRARAQTLLDNLTGDTQLLARTLEAVGLSPQAGEASVQLVRHAPPPGAMTYRTAQGPVSIVAEDGLDDDTLLEVALHETLHAFDTLAPADDHTIFAELRRALTDRGLSPSDPAFRTVWHTLFFVHAAEMVRRDGRPGYTDYAERAGIYEKSGPAASLMRELWPRVLDGEMTRAEFFHAIIDALPGGDDVAEPRDD